MYVHCPRLDRVAFISLGSRGLWGLGLALVLAVLPRPIQAQPSEETSEVTYEARSSNPSRRDLSDENRRRLKRYLVEGRRHEKKEDYREALESYRSAYRLFPHSAVLLSLGRVHAELGHADRAIRAYRCVLDQHPDYSHRERVRSTIERLQAERTSSSDELTAVQTVLAMPTWEHGGDARSSSTSSPPRSNTTDTSLEGGASTGSTSPSKAHVPPSRASRRSWLQTIGPLGWTGAGAVVGGLGAFVGAGVAESTRSRHVKRLRRAARADDEEAFRVLKRRAARARRLRGALLYTGAGLSIAGGTLMAFEWMGREERSGTSASTVQIRATTTSGGGLGLEGELRF